MKCVENNFLGTRSTGLLEGKVQASGSGVLIGEDSELFALADLQQANEQGTPVGTGA